MLVCKTDVILKDTRKGKKMAIREVVLIGDPVLRKKAAPVRNFGPELQQLVDDMIDTMREAPGVGLAAPQVGISQRLIVVETPENEEEPASGKLFAVANPQVVKASREEEEGEEGCLPFQAMLGMFGGRPGSLSKGKTVAASRFA